MELLKVSNITKVYNTGKGMRQFKALNGVSFDVHEGEFVAIMGPSGSGKTTLLNILATLDKPTCGEVLLDGHSFNRVKDSESARFRREHLGFVFQDFNLLDSFNLKDNILLPLVLSRMDVNEMERRLSPIAKMLGIEELLTKFPYEVSGGEKQRVGIARALALNPEFLVLDEPVSALDVSIQAQVLNLMQQLQKDRGLTYLFISHNLSVVKHISDRIAVMYLGRMVELADCKQLFKNPVHPYTKALLSAVPIPRLDVKTERILLEGDVPSPVNPAPGCRFAGRCAQCMERCTAEQPELREIEPGHFVACHLCDR